MGSIAIPSGIGGGTIADKSFTTLYSRDMSSWGYATKTVTIPEDITEVILSTAESWDDTVTKVNSKSSNMTQKYVAAVLGGGHGKGHIWVYSKKKGETSSINFTVTGGRLIAR